VTRLVVRHLFLLITGAVAGSVFGASVADFGAAGDGLSDDTSAIQSAINALQVHESLYFPSGVYRLTRTLRLLPDRNYLGGDGAVLEGPGNMFLAATIPNQARDIVIYNLVFDRGGLLVDGGGMPASGMNITSCTFQNIVSSSPNWTVHNGITIVSGLRDSLIARNRFQNILEQGLADSKDRTANGIVGWRIERSTICDNTFDTVNQAISLQFDGPGPYDEVFVLRNQGRRVHRMGIEMQGANTNGLTVEENEFRDFLNPFWNTFGLSIAVDGGYGAVIRNNTLDGTPAPARGRYGYGIEVGGKSSLVEGNTISGFFVMGIAIGNAPNVVVRGNRLSGSPGAQTIGFEGQPPPGAVIER
jgi:hypothetical protein